jgi:outer membrane protein assembly factor BamB
VFDIHFAAGRVLFLCEYPPGEEEMVMPPTGPQAPVADLRAVDLRSGKLAWMKDGTIPDPLAVVGDRVYVVIDGSLTALDARRGKVLWKAAVAGDVVVGPSADSRFVFVQGEDGHLQAFSAGAGEKLWTKRLEGPPRAPATVGPGHVYLPRIHASKTDDGDSTVYAVDKASGEVAWKRKLKNEHAFYQGVVWKDLLLIPAMGNDDPGHLYALSLEDGDVRWKKEVGPDANGHDFRPVVWKDQIYVWSGGDDEETAGEVYLLLNLDAATGKTNWTYRPRLPEKAMLSRPFVRPGRIVYGDGERLYGLRRVRSRSRPGPTPRPE